MALKIYAMSSTFDFVFLDEAKRPFYCYSWNGEKWLFYWCDNHWVSLRRITDMDIFPLNLSDMEQQIYHKLHAEWGLLQANNIKLRNEIEGIVNAKS
jgi:hypothetical protein